MSRSHYLAQPEGGSTASPDAPNRIKIVKIPNQFSLYTQAPTEMFTESLTTSDSTPRARFGIGPALSFLAQQPAAGGAPAPAAQGATLFAAVVSAIKSGVEEIRHPFVGRGGYPHTAEKGKHGRGGPNVVHDWTVRIRFNKHELGEGFMVLIFLGEVPDDAPQWRTCPCQYGNPREQVSEGFVHLNSPIADRTGLSSYEPNVVIPYLRDNLNWRIQGTDRTSVAVERLPSLEVTVIQTTLTEEPGSVFPIAGAPQYHHHITYGRPGGARHAQA
ncbi:hypothetical protein BJV78DRAFT_1349425 [Lactifluus subvellereus]|nr:hypothetical protein BJV78DRAFT_1349425 [Lactifluus subvellereus]